MIAAAAFWRTQLPAELRFLLDVMAASFRPVILHAPFGIDWGRFLDAVGHHRVVPLMGPALAADGPVPEAVRVQLLELQRQATRRMLALGGELVGVATAFQAAGIELVVLKGPALSELLYGDPWRRFSRDIDLMVRPEAEAAALDLLCTLGYGENGQLIARNTNAVSLYHQRFSFPLELHVRFGDDDRLLPCRLVRPFENVARVSIGGQHIPTLGPEAAVVYAVYHGTNHVWSLLYWLADMAAFQRSGVVDWPAALDLARRAGVERQLALAMVLVEDLIGVSLPAVLAREAALIGRARRAARPLRAVIAGTGDGDDRAAFHRFGGLRYVVWDALMYRRPAARWAALANRAQPSERDRGWLRLPDWLGFLYYGVRLARVIGGACSGIVGRRR